MSLNFVTKPTNLLASKVQPFTKECKNRRSVRLSAWPWRDVARFAVPSIAEMFSNIIPVNSFPLYIGYNDTFTYWWLKLF